MKSQVITLGADQAGSIELDDAMFGLEPRRDLLQRMVVWQLARRRAGTGSAKGRSDISGTSRKMIRQKGSGGARHGNRKAPQFRGGGKAHGPVVRNHTIKLPKKVRALALKHALSTKARNSDLIILDQARSEEGKASVMRHQLEALGIKNALVVDGAEIDEKFALATRNFASVDLLPIQGINVYDILRRDTLVLTKAAIEGLKARFK
ncbi:MAG: 50S ribosomal protein L4 [Parvularculales bacterium]